MFTLFSIQFGVITVQVDKLLVCGEDIWFPGDIAVSVDNRYAYG